VYFISAINLLLDCCSCTARCTRGVAMIDAATWDCTVATSDVTMTIMKNNVSVISRLKQGLFILVASKYTHLVMFKHCNAMTVVETLM